MNQINGKELVPVGQPHTAMVARQEFGASQVQTQAETALAAVTARERAVVEARFLMAERHPRNWDTVRVRVLSHCDRPRFAEVAKYRKPVGSKQINGEWVPQFVEGLSARFAETAAQEAGNIYCESPITYEDDLIRIVRPTVTDLERNVTFAQETAIAKTVERRGKKNRQGEWQPPESREALSSRINSYGDPVFLVKATDDELRNKQAAEISKIQRNFLLKLLPRDIQEEALDKIEVTLSDPKKTDPTEARKRIIDGFFALSITPEDLVAYLAHGLDKIVPAELKELRGLYTAIRDGDTTFQEALRARSGEPAEGEQETGQQHDARLRRQMKQQEVLARKLAEMEAEKKAGDDAPTAQAEAPTAETAELTDEENRARDAKIAAEEQQPLEKPKFGQRRTK